MDFTIMLERIETLCAANGIKNRQTAYIESGVGKDFGVNIKKGSKPSVEKIIALADYFDVSIDYLLGRNDTDEFLRRFAKLPKEDRDTILTLIDKLSKY